MMHLMSKLAGPALASILLGACATQPEVTALSDQDYRVWDVEEANQPRYPDMKQGTRRALRQAAQLARRKDADYLRVRDVRITETTKQVPVPQERLVKPIAQGGLIGLLIGEVISAVIEANRTPPPGGPTITVNVRQVYLDFEISAEDQVPGEDFLLVRRVLEITAPFDNDEEQVSDTYHLTGVRRVGFIGR